ncbi:MAG: hypothetical protein KDC84_14210 [Crocinitomicaceae bacterium]|nr:hypothetical protein [Crocinitomicaceae bacterium]
MAKKTITDKSKIALILGYVAFVTIVFLGVVYLFSSLTLSQSAFLSWDAYHYHTIAFLSYNFSNVAFFPLFPLVWSLSGLSVYGISIFNLILFLLFFFLLSKELKNCPLETTLFLSIPSLIFMALPYSESIFFLASVLMLLGMNKEKFYWVLIGLFIASLSRPVFTVFIPAFLISELLSNRTIKQKLVRSTLFIFVAISGLLFASYIQFRETDVWFAAFKVQQHWDTYFRLPDFPLRSWAAGIPTRLDGLALLFGTVAGVVVLLRIFKNKVLSKFSFSQSEIFALSYLAGISLTVLFFRGGWLPSLNRYVFATAFFIVAFNLFLRLKFKISWKVVGISFLIITAYWLMFESYGHIQTLLKFALVSLIPIGILLFKNENKTVRQIAFISIIAVNVVFQIYFYFRHLSSDWVG